MKAILVRCSRATLTGYWARKLSSAVVAITFGACLFTRVQAASVSLAWDPNPEPDVIGYRIYYGPAGGTPTTSQDAGASTATTVTGLQEGASYSFYATAYNSAGLESELSSPVSYTVPSSANNFVVTWEKSFSVNAAGYRFLYGPPNQTPTVRNVGTSLSATISNVVRGATYELTVEALDSSGSPVTEYELVTYTIPQTGLIGSVHLLPIDQPPSVALTSPGNGSQYLAPAAIQINAQAADDDAVQFVDVFAGGNLLRRLTATPYVLTWSDVPAGQYEIFAIAVDSSDQFTRSGSSVVTVETLQPSPALPAAPSALSASYNSKNGRLRLDWIDNATNEESYVVERSVDGTNFVRIKTLAANKESFADSSVQRGARYYYRVRAVNAAGSNVSNVISVQT